MTKITKEMVTSVIFLICIMIFLLGIAPTWYMRHKGGISNDTVTISWEERYPFDSSVTEISKKSNILDKYMHVVDFIKRKCSTLVRNNTIARYPISELYCKMEKCLGYKRIASEDGSVLVLEDGYFCYQSINDMSKESINVVEYIEGFQSWLEDQGIDYLYVMEPLKTSPVNEKSIYEGYVDYQRSNAETFANLMEESEVNFLNLQARAEETGNLNGLFYKTDHHWTPSTALWAAEVLAGHLNENFDFQVDLENYRVDRFEKIKYGRCFLGSQGKKVTLAYTEPDEFELLLPSYDTELHVMIPEHCIDDVGSFYEMLIDQEKLKNEGYPSVFYELNQYAAYGYGDQPLIIVENSAVSEGKKVLLLKDSYGDVLGPFLSLGLRNISLMDLRHFTGSLRAYIREYQPDIVITMLSGGGRDLNTDNETHTNILDYR